MDPLTNADTFDQNLGLLSRLVPSLSGDCVRQAALQFCSKHQYVLQRFLLIVPETLERDPDVQGADWVARSLRARHLRTVATTLSSLATILPSSRVSLQQAKALTNLARQLHDCLKLYDSYDRPCFAPQRDAMVLSIKLILCISAWVSRHYKALYLLLSAPSVYPLSPDLLEAVLVLEQGYEQGKADYVAHLKADDGRGSFDPTRCSFDA